MTNHLTRINQCAWAIFGLAAVAGFVIALLGEKKPAAVQHKTVELAYSGTGASNVVVDMRNAGRRWQRQPLLGRMFDGVLRDTNGVPIVDDPQLLAAAEQLSRLLTNYCILVSPIP